MSSKDIINSIRNRSNKGMAAPIMNVKVSGGGSNAMLVKQQCELNKSIQEMLEKLSDCDQIRSCFESGNGITIDDGVISLQFSSFANDPSFVEAVQDAIGDNIESMIYDDENNQWNIVLVAQFDNTTNGVISVSGSGTADDPFVLDTGSEFCNEVVSCVQNAESITLKNLVVDGTTTLKGDVTAEGDVTVQGGLTVDGTLTADNMTLPANTDLFTIGGTTITSGAEAETPIKNLLQTELAQIQTNTQAIQTQGNTIQTQGDKIETNEQAIETNKNSIESNKATIQGLSTTTQQNTAAIEENKGNIENNTNTISEHTNTISEHTNTLDEHNTAIEQNKINIQTNTDAINNNTNDIADVKSSISTLEDSVNASNQATDTVTDTVAGHKIAKHTAKDGTEVEINETITELVDFTKDGNVLTIKHKNETGNTTNKSLDITDILEGAVANFTDDQVLSAAADSPMALTFTPNVVTDTDGSSQTNYEISSTVKPTYIKSGNALSDSNKIITEDTLEETKQASTQAIQAVQEQVTSNDNDIEALQNQQSTNTSAITALQSTTQTQGETLEQVKTQQETNTSDISDLKSTVETQGNSLTTLQSAQETNAQNIASNDTDIEALQTQQGTNTSNISDLQNTVQALQQGSQSTTTEINEVKENVTKIEKYNTDQSYISFDQGTVVQDVLLPHFKDESMADANRGHYIKSRAAFTGVKFIAASLYFSTPVSADTTLELYVNNNAIGTITVTASNKFAEITSFTNTDFTDGALITYKFTSVTDTDLEGQLILETLDQ